MGDGPMPGGGQEPGRLQSDLESILGRSTVAVEPIIRLSAAPDEAAPPRSASPLIVLLPRDVPRRRQRPGWILPSIVGAGLLSVAVLGFSATRLRSGTSTASPVAAPATELPAPTEPVAAVAAPTTVPAAAPSTVAAPARPLEPRSAVFAGGKVYLRGAVPDAATARVIVERAKSVVGVDNVVDEYVVDPAASTADSAPLRIADTVQFAAGGASIAPEFRSLLDLGVVLLERYPKVEITVIGHTDAAGDAAENQRLSQRRVDAVVAYLTRNGVDRSRVVGVAKGEAEPIAGNDTAEGRRLNRRIEFIITGLLEP